MTGRVLTCACCGEPLQVVCPTHGSGVVARSWPEPPRAAVPDAGPDVGFTVRPGSIRARLLSALDQTTPASAPAVAAVLGITRKHAAVELRYLTERGAVRRVRHGLYVRVAGGIG